MGVFNRRINGAVFPPSTFVIQDIMENSDGNFSAIGMNIQLFNVLLVLFLKSTAAAGH
jgi:hypothetical protein